MSFKTQTMRLGGYALSGKVPQKNPNSDLPGHEHEQRVAHEVK